MWGISQSVVVALVVLAFAAPANAGSFSFSTGNADGKIALGSRPDIGGGTQIEAADDFVLTESTSLAGATFTGLLPSAAPLSSIQQVRVGVYRLFPADSDVSRTSGSPTFSTSLVPTRVNSPSDSRFGLRDSANGGLSFTASNLGPYSALNSVLNGIHPKPGQTTGGDGSVSGEEVKFTVQFTPTLNLAADHYFFVPQVELTSGDFYWLSAPDPIVSPGTPFPGGATDQQSWIRNAGLEPDWLRVGGDIVGGGNKYNGTFSLSGVTCQAITLSPASLPGATAGEAYSAAITASGGVAPYGFSENGALPQGVSLDSGGALAGTPTESGSFPFTVTASDANGCTGSASYTLDVAAAAAGPSPLQPVSPATPSPSPMPAPAITADRLSPKTFRAAAHGATLTRRRHPPVGTTVSYVDSEAATTTFAVLEPVKGHRRGKRCVAGRAKKHQKSCTRWVPVGSSVHVDRAGKVKTRFNGRIHRRKLKPGRYRLTLTPKANGVKGRTVALTFRIVR